VTVQTIKDNSSKLNLALTTKVGTVILSGAKDLFAHRERPFAPLRVTKHSRSWLLKLIIGLCRLFRYPDYKVKKLYQKDIVDPALVLVPMLPSYARLVAPDRYVDMPYPPASLQIDG